MTGMYVRLFWFALTAILIAFAAHLFFGSTIAASAEDELREVVVQTEYREGAHHISGMVFVPTNCHDLHVKTSDLDAKTMVLVFETWKQPYRECDTQFVPRAFKVVSFAPADIQFRAIFDDEWRPVRLISKKTSYE